MVLVGERVDDRDGRPARELLDGLLGERADDDRGHVAGQRAGRVGDRLAAAELQLLRRQRDRRRSEPRRRGRERDARPRRRLLEDAGDRLPRSASSQCAGSSFSDSASSSSPASSSGARSETRVKCGRRRSWSIVIPSPRHDRSGARCLRLRDDRLEHVGDRRLADLLELVATWRIGCRDAIRRPRSIGVPVTTTSQSAALIVCSSSWSCSSE